MGISRCKLLYTEWINNEVLLYSTGNYIQYPVIDGNGKDYKKSVYMCVCVCVTESLCCTAETNIIFQINYTSIKKPNPQSQKHTHKPSAQNREEGRVRNTQGPQDGCLMAPGTGTLCYQLYLHHFLLDWPQIPYVGWDLIFKPKSQDWQ